MIPEYAHWHILTQQDFKHYRSSKLKAVGSALQRYNRNETASNLDALWSALVVHKTSKRAEFRSRDRRRAMTDLYDAVEAERSARQERRSARPVRGPGPPVPLRNRTAGPPVPLRKRTGPPVPRRRRNAGPPVPTRRRAPVAATHTVAAPGPASQERGPGLRAGDVIDVKVPLADGRIRHYQMTIQAKGNNCGPTCIKMVIKLLWNASVSVDAIEGSTANAEGRLTRHDWENEGTAAIPQGFTNALKDTAGSGKRADIGVYGTLNGTLMEGLKKVTPKSPAIVRVGWTGGGGHFVVVPQWYGAHNNRLVVLDPWFGLQTVAVPGNVDLYEPQPGSTATLDWLTLIKRQ